VDTALDSRVTVRLFIGCAVNPELRINLTHSLPWKQASIMRATDQDLLLETHFQNKSYIGLYVDDQQFTLQQIRKDQQKIREQLLIYCPKLTGIDKLPIYVFPQIFVS